MIAGVESHRQLPRLEPDLSRVAATEVPKTCLGWTHVQNMWGMYGYASISRVEL